MQKCSACTIVPTSVVKVLCPYCHAAIVLPAADSTPVQFDPTLSALLDHVLLVEEALCELRRALEAYLTTRYTAARQSLNHLQGGDI